MDVNVNYISIFENTMFQFGSLMEIKCYVVENKQTFREIWKKKEVCYSLKIINYSEELQQL